MYNQETGQFACDTCGFESGWNDCDDTHGELWGCEECGDTFCSKCFKDKHGEEAYWNMMQDHVICCPTCLAQEV